MKKLLAVMIAAIFMFTGCTKMNKNAEVSDKLKITVTTSILEDMANRLIGDKAEISVIIPAGENPHGYEPTPEDLEKITGADLIFYQGLEFEGELGEVLEQNEKAFAISETFSQEELIEADHDHDHDDAEKEEHDHDHDDKEHNHDHEHHHHGEFDPHFWFDINLYKKALATMEGYLVSYMPEDEKFITENSIKYMEEIDAMREKALEKISEIPAESRVLITQHDALGYFAREYGLNVFSPQGISTESEVSIQDIEEISDLVFNAKIKAIFVENTANPETMNKIKETVKAKGFDVKIVSGKNEQLFVDSTAPKGQKGDTYISMVEHNVDVIATNLK